MKLIAITLTVIRSASAQSRPEPLPKFEEYSVKTIFQGTPHLPILITSKQRYYRTRIREGVEKGWGAWINGKEQNRPGPNFAGHYVVIVWSCGAPCLMMAVCDVETGAVYNPPLSEAGGFTLPLLVPRNSVGRNADFQYRRDSRLMIIQATPHGDQRDAKSYSFYFLLQNNRWKLLRRIPIPDE